MAFSPQAPRRLTLVSVLSLIGAGSAIYLSHLYYSLRGGTAGFKSLCNINDTMNCSAVASSSYAELFPGLPLSSLAAGAMIAIFLVSLLARNFDWRRDGIRTAFALSLISTVFSVLYFGVMAAVLKTFCLFCVFVDLASLGCLITLLTLKPEPFSRAPFDKEQITTWIGLPIGAVLITVVALKGLDALSVPNSSLDEVAVSLLQTPPVAVKSGPELPSLGADASAPITIVEFSDFQCPHCRNGAMILNAVKSRYPRQVRIVYRGYPLDPSCNRKMQAGGGHTIACEAARAALCSQAQGKFEPYYEKTFENQDSIVAGKPVEYAKSLGLDPAAFDRCMSSPEIATRVTQDIEEGIQLGVESTPTFFLNGRKIDGAYPVPVWNRMIDTLLASPPSK